MSHSFINLWLLFSQLNDFPKARFSLSSAVLKPEGCPFSPFLIIHSLLRVIHQFTPGLIVCHCPDHFRSLFKSFSFFYSLWLKLFLSFSFPLLSLSLSLSLSLFRPHSFKLTVTTSVGLLKQQMLTRLLHCKVEHLSSSLTELPAHSLFNQGPQPRGWHRLGSFPPHCQEVTIQDDP